MQIIIARIRQTSASRDKDINELAATVARRIRVVQVNSVAAFEVKYDAIAHRVSNCAELPKYIVSCDEQVQGSATCHSQAQDQAVDY